MTGTGNIGLSRFVRQPAAAGQPAVARQPAQVLPGELPAALASRLSNAGAAQAEAADAERCEFCGAEVADEHGHVADLEGASLICSCRACYLLFTQGAAARGRYKSVPDRYCYEPDGGLTAAEWDELQVPVGLAFFLRTAAGQLTGFYPSPAGATECQLDLQAWQRLAAGHPMLTAAEPDVEAVLLSRSGEGVECFLVPIDVCYELAGRMRLHWRGFDGGEEARASIAAFLASVRSRARAFGEA